MSDPAGTGGAREKGGGLASHSDLYGDDILLWSEKQGALLRRLSVGERVNDQVDWPHVVEEIEEVGRDRAQRSANSPTDPKAEIARLTARLAAAEAKVEEFRARLDDMAAELADAQAELAAAQDQAEAASARAVAAVEAEQAVRQARAETDGKLRRELEAAREALDAVRAGTRWQRIRRAWRGT